LAHTRDIAAGSSQTGDEVASQRVAGVRHDDWNGRGGPLGRERCERSECHNDVDVEANQLRREFSQPVEPIFGPAALKRDVFAFDPSQLRQSIEKTFSGKWLGTCVEIADLVCLPGLLRTGCHRPSCRRAAKKRDEVAALHAHSITSSAATRSLSGTMRPSILAVW